MNNNIDPTTRIIFLDIDGVMNHAIYFKRRKEGKFERDPIDPECVQYLNRIIAATGAKVVISSTWRMHYDIEYMQTILDQKGFEGEVIGETPDVYSSHKYNAPRGCEIKDWIKKHVERDNYDLTYRRFIILDDDSDMLLSQAEHFIRTDFMGAGLTENLAYRAKRTLLGLENIYTEDHTL
mgnify:CR=1 FL=1